jgi:hypothetical protein
MDKPKILNALSLTQAQRELVIVFGAAESSAESSVMELFPCDDSSLDTTALLRMLSSAGDASSPDATVADTSGPRRRRPPRRRRRRRPGAGIVVSREMLPIVTASVATAVGAIADTGLR